MKKNGLSFLFLALSAGAMVAQGGALEPFKPGEVTVRGELGRRMEITAAHIMNDIDVDGEFVRHFRVRKEKPEVRDGFTGWGMLLDAIVKAAAHGVGGEKFRAFKEKWMAETIATQTPDGNISIFAGQLGLWDGHEQGYMLQGFIRDWEWFGNRAALEAARRLADYMIARKVACQAGISPAFAYLSQQTGDSRYVDFLRDAYGIEKDAAAYVAVVPINGLDHVYGYFEWVFSRLVYAGTTGRPVPTLEETGREAYRRLAGDHMSVTGTVGGQPNIGEYWDDSQIGLQPWGETCASAYLMRMTAEWMKTHPSSVYGDLYERVMYNALFGAQSHDGKKLRYFSPFNQPGEWWPNNGYCCPNNFRRMVFEIPDFVFLRTPDGFAVNLFAPATLKTKGLAVEMSTAYPDDGAVELKVTSEKAGKMRVRVPRWTGLADAGSWRAYDYAAGETSVRVEFPMAIRLVKGRRAQEGRFALMRGPVVYAVPMGGAYIDCWKFDLSRPMSFRDGCVEASMIDDHYRRPRYDVKLVPFAAENRKRVYFPTTGEGGPELEDDEFFGCAELLAK